jgi:hypothetical protein
VEASGRRSGVHKRDRLNRFADELDQRASELDAEAVALRRPKGN